MTQRPQLRPLTAADAPAVHALFASTRVPELAHLPLSASQRDAFVRMQVHAQQVHYARHYPDATMDAVMLDGRLMGRLCVWRQAGEICLIDISLFPEVRGAGLGTCLLEALIDEAVAATSKLTLHVKSDSRAKAWYRRLGFQEGQDDGVNTSMWLAVKPA